MWGCGARARCLRSPHTTMSDGSGPTYLVVETGSHEGQRGGVDYVEDLDSAGGTFVNGEAITVPRRLYPGDRVAFADLQLRYGTGEGAPTAVRYEIGDQRAHTINNVGRDQYVQQVIQQRENFFREIAATKTKARGLIWTGVVVFLVGLAIAAVGWYTYFGQILDLSSASSMPTKDDLSGFALGGLVNLVGVLLIITGIVLHVVAYETRWNSAGSDIAYSQRTDSALSAARCSPGSVC